MTLLPRPTGPFAIGTLTRHWVDRDRREIFAGPDAGPRELMVQIWYPAKPGSLGPRAPYVDDARTLRALATLVGLPTTAFAHLEHVSTHAIVDAPAANERQTNPVILLSHGRCGMREHNTVQVEDLASHGYVVVTIDHPYAASGVRFPDGRLIEFDPRLLPPWPRRVRSGLDAGLLDRVIPFLADDVRFVLDRLEVLNGDRSEILGGRLELDRVGIVGVSLGGLVAAEAMLREARLAAGQILDVYVPHDVVAVGLRQPVMFMTRDAATMRREGWDEAEIADTHATIRRLFERLPRDGYIVLVPGMYHIDFSDGRLLSDLVAARGISGPIDVRKALGVVRAYGVAFFDRHLERLATPLLDERPGPDAGVMFESRRTGLAPRARSVTPSAARGASTADRS